VISNLDNGEAVLSEEIVEVAGLYSGSGLSVETIAFLNFGLILFHALR
jgi:hypothetical protein